MPHKEGSSLVWRTYGLSFSERLKWLRNHRKLSQERLAQLSGMHRNQISNLERNVSRDPGSPADPHLSTVYELARALDVAPDLLLPDLGRTPATTSRENRVGSSFSAVEEKLAAALAEERRRR